MRPSMVIGAVFISAVAATLTGLAYVDSSIHTIGQEGSIAQRDDLTLVDHGIRPISDSDDHSNLNSRGDVLTFVDHGIQPISNSDDGSNLNTRRDELTEVLRNTRPISEVDPPSLEKRGNRVTRCGYHDDHASSGWTPIEENHKAGWKGYRAAAQEFCYHATHGYDGNPTIIGPGLKYSTQINGVTLTSSARGHVNFTIENYKKEGTHGVVEDAYNEYMMNIAIKGSPCHGTKNQDTLGGTYYVDGTGNYKSMPGTGES